MIYTMREEEEGGGVTPRAQIIAIEANFALSRQQKIERPLVENNYVSRREIINHIAYILN